MGRATRGQKPVQIPDATPGTDDTPKARHSDSNLEAIHGARLTRRDRTSFEPGRVDLRACWVGRLTVLLRRSSLLLSKSSFPACARRHTSVFRDALFVSLDASSRR